MRLQGKNIILTGASRGFGKCLAERLWDEGASLLCVSRNQTTVSLPNRRGQSYFGMSGDLLWFNTLQDLMTKAGEIWPHIDGLVNNAAIQGPMGAVISNDRVKVWDTIVTDLLAPMDLCRLVVPEMLKCGHGKIVNLSGGGATNARPNFSAYATAKAGLVKFSECLAAELAGKGIDVNCVAPGQLSTNMQQEIIKAGPVCAGEMEYQRAHMTVPASVMQKAADLIVWLLSDESDGITGRLIAAQWDDWQHMTKDDLFPDTWTLRRVEAPRPREEWDI